MVPTAPSKVSRGRKAILLVGGDKSGGSEKKFYRALLRSADERWDAHLARLRQERR